MNEKQNISIPIEYVNQWIEDHHEYMNTRVIRFMVQDYQYEKLKIRPHKSYFEEMVERQIEDEQI